MSDSQSMSDVSTAPVGNVVHRGTVRHLQETDSARSAGSISGSDVGRSRSPDETRSPDADTNRVPVYVGDQNEDTAVPYDATPVGETLLSDLDKMRLSAGTLGRGERRSRKGGSSSGSQSSLQVGDVRETQERDTCDVRSRSGSSIGRQSGPSADVRNRAKASSAAPATTAEWTPSLRQSRSMVEARQALPKEGMASRRIESSASRTGAALDVSSIPGEADLVLSLIHI